MKYLLSCIFILSGLSAFATKTVYIPLYLQDITSVDGAQFSWDKTVESANFILIWGNTVGTDPASYTADPGLAFDPAVILDTMEMLYTRFKTLGFLNDDTLTNLHQYKIPIIMYNTWGPTGAMGYANGGSADGVIGAFWVHPIAMQTGQVAAHELTHSLQAECVIDYRTAHGLGGAWDYAGIFWETHANFMRNLIYPQDVTAWGMDEYHVEGWGDWKNTYENYELLLAVMESEGLQMVDSLWMKSYSYEYPLQTYKRIAGYSQGRFNDSLYHYARRMATFDFPYNSMGDYFRSYHNDDMINWLPSVQAAYTILRKTADTDQHYEVPIELAPEEYAYNTIPLYMNPDSCSVIIKFKGHTEVNSHAGWRYGFVTAHPDGTVSRYSETYSDNVKEINFALQGDENKMYLVVMGAPADAITTDTSNDTWHGYPKHFRYPYALTISGAVPEGFQAADQFRAQLKTDGHLHSNGGGWVANSATVTASVYVAPAAMVLGTANLSGNVRMEGTALVKDATLSDNVKVTDNAFVNGGTYSENALIRGQALSENNVMSGTAMIGMRAHVANYHLSGNIEVGGDVVVYNNTGNCDNGVYYRMTNYYEDNLLECDGRTATHPANLDVNNTLSAFTDAQMTMNCNCALLPDCLTLGITAMQGRHQILALPNPSNDHITFTNTKPIRGGITVDLYTAVGVQVAFAKELVVSSCRLDVSGLPAGVYLARVTAAGISETIKITVAE